MSKPLTVDLFVEDRAHEEFLKPFLVRVAREEGIAVKVRVRCARGGHGRAMSEFQTFQRLIEKGLADLPDIIVVGLDGNCASFALQRTEILKKTTAAFRDKVIAACPDPHIERWYLADSEAFYSVVGTRPSVPQGKCDHDFYKNLLARSIRKAGHLPTLGGIEFAADLVEAMDLYRAGKSDHALAAFVDELRGRLREQRSRGN